MNKTYKRLISALCAAAVTRSGIPFGGNLSVPVFAENLPLTKSFEDMLSPSYNKSCDNLVAMEYESGNQMITPAADGTPDTEPAYTYEIIPLLSPFNEYFYVRTDDPDPSGFRFADADSVYSESSLIRFVETKYADVLYEDPDLLRVNGGYLFYSGTTDGGDISLERKKGSWTDTGITITLPKLIDDADYLIETYATESGFFENMDAVESGFSSICLYSGSYIRGEISKRDFFFGLSNSPHVDQSLYIQSPYTRSGSESLFASAIYPYRYDSLGFPGMMSVIAKRLDSSAVTARNANNHYLIEVTLGDETRSYGGQGHGEGQGISADKLSRIFSFEAGAEEITLDGAKALLTEYATLEMDDDVPHEGQLTWKEVTDLAGSGKWVSIIQISSVFGGYSRAYAFLYKIDNRDYFFTSDVGVGGSLYWSGSLGYASDSWVDGRYVSNRECLVPGETFADHPESNIILTDITIPIIDYDMTWKQNSETGEFESVYEITEITEEKRTVKYRYNADDEIWEAESNAFSETSMSLSKIRQFTEQGLIDEQYLDALVLTKDEVLAMGVDRNTNIEPDHYYIFDESAEPGTEVFSGDVNCDGECNIADAAALQKWLLGMPDAALDNWYAADFDNNEKINAKDLAVMKSKLLSVT